jgi:hypothetical protein
LEPEAPRVARRGADEGAGALDTAATHGAPSITTPALARRRRIRRRRAALETHERGRLRGRQPPPHTPPQ